MTAEARAVDALAAEMYGLFRHHRLERTTDVAIDSLSLADAYRVQEQVIARRVADGERHVGWKVGCTSRAIQRQFGLTEPVNAHLMAPHVHEDGAELDLGDYLDCAIEAELVLHIGTALEGENLPDAVLQDAIAGVSAGIELHNYRFAHGAPTSQELIASNAIHAGLVVSGSAVLIEDLALEGVGAWVNDGLRTSALNAEILGSGPLASLRWLVADLTRRGRCLEPGQLVIPGSAVELVRVAAGDVVTARFTRAGTCRARFTGAPA